MIFIIEDEKAPQEALAARLKKDGFEIEAAFGGAGTTANFIPPIA